MITDKRQLLSNLVFGIFLFGFIFFFFYMLIIMTKDFLPDIKGGLFPEKRKRVECLILEKKIIEKNRGTKVNPIMYYEPEITFRFEHKGQSYRVKECGWMGKMSITAKQTTETAQNLLDRYDIGSTGTCIFDPRYPSRAFLHKRVNPTRFSEAVFMIIILAACYLFFMMVCIVLIISWINRIRFSV